MQYNNIDETVNEWCEQYTASSNRLIFLNATSFPDFSKNSGLADFETRESGSEIPRFETIVTSQD